MSNTREYLEAVFNGKIPIKRKNPQTGREEEVYYNYDDDKEELVEKNNPPFFDMRRITHTIELPSFTKKMMTGNYRTPLSNFPENWGKKTESALENYLATGYKEPDYQQYNIQKNNIGSQSNFLEMLYRTYAPIQDLRRNANILNEMNLDGGDKFFHCKGNYEAAKRGTWEAEVAQKLSQYREIFQSLDPNATLQDASDDIEANRRGIEGAKAGKSLFESCPRNPREYFK